MSFYKERKWHCAHFTARETEAQKDKMLLVLLNWTLRLEQF